jgi:hypothetical protein
MSLYRREKPDKKNDLSDSKTKCWLSGSKSAFAKSLLSASIIAKLPQLTFMKI